MKSDSLVGTWQDQPLQRLVVNAAVTIGSLLLCLLLLPTRLPGMELAGIGPNWLLIWVVAWSVNRTMFQGAMAGLVLGLIQDGMTARLRKGRYIQEDFISVALIAFGTAVIAETVMAIQYSFQAERSLVEIWNYHQLIALSSAILSSLWAPVVYFPLNRWWQWVENLEQ
jgi:cell shape-determining protein MreD